LVAGRDASAALELTGVGGSGSAADLDVVTRWLDGGVAPCGASGRGFGARSVHGFDLTFCAPKSVSVVRARGDDVIGKAVADAHAHAIAAAMEYLAQHAGYTRTHNPVTGAKDLVRLPAIVAASFQHETSRAGDPHLHTHVLVPNRQARADGSLVSIDGTSLYHEARAAGMIYQATLRREMTRSMGIEWGAVDAHTGMAEIAGVSRADIGAWSQRATQLHEWAQGNLVIDGHPATPAQLAAAQKATRPRKPEGLSWGQLRAQWAADERGFRVDRQAQQVVRAARRSAVVDYPAAVGQAVRAGLKAATFTRADLVEAIGARLPVDEADARDPRTVIEGLVDLIALRVDDERQPHQREGSVRYTAADLIAEEAAILELMGGRDRRAALPVVDTAGLSADQGRAITAIATSDRLVAPLSAPAGAGKTHSLRALRAAAEAAGRRVVVAAPTGRAVDVAVREGAGNTGATIDALLGQIERGQTVLDPGTVVVVDEAGMVGTAHLRALLAAAAAAGCKTVLVGDEHQLAPVGGRAGTFAALVADLPWAQRLSEVWRMRDPDERQASLAVRDGGPAALRRAVGWYRHHGRVHTGDAVTMAADALTAWQAERDAGHDALLIADRWTMADAINTRIHRDRIDEDTPTVAAARGHRIAAGDIVITRHNDAAIPVWTDRTMTTPADPVRNGQRWDVLRIDPERDRIALRRLSDGAIAALAGDYLRQHTHLGYAVTTHAAQGVTADTCHALLAADTATRSLGYVALTRGRHSNTVRLYTAAAGEGDHEHAETTAGRHTARRGPAAEAAALLRQVLGRDDRAATITAATAERDLDAESRLPEPVAALHRHHRGVVARLRREHRSAIGTDIGTPIDRVREARAQSAADPSRAADTARAGTARAGAVLVERVGDLQAAVEVVAASGGRSAAAIYPRLPAQQSAGLDLDERGRQVVSAVAASMMSVQPVSITDPGQRGAVIDALARTAAAAAAANWPREHHHRVWLVPAGPESAAVVEAVRGVAGVSVIDPGEVIAAMADPQRRLPVGGLLIVDGADQLAVEQLTALCVDASATNTKLVLVSDPAAGGPSREITGALAGDLSWSQHLGDQPGRSATIVARAAAWATTQPTATTGVGVDAADPGRDLPDWLRHTLTDAAQHRSTATIGRPPSAEVLADLSPPARRAVRRIAASPTTVQTLDLDTTADGGGDKAAVITALSRTGGRPGTQMMVVPIGPGTAAQAADQPYQRYLRAAATASQILSRPASTPPAGSRIVLDGADHLTTDTLSWWLRTATRHDLTLVLITDRANPGPSRALTDTLAATAPWAAHHFHRTPSAAADTISALVTAHTRITETRRHAEQEIARREERYRRQERARNQHRSRDTGHDLSL
jgi:conjugative relaxase-like TrwC/TraI family protein